MPRSNPSEQMPPMPPPASNRAEYLPPTEVKGAKRAAQPAEAPLEIVLPAGMIDKDQIEAKDTGPAEPATTTGRRASHPPIEAGQSMPAVRVKRIETGRRAYVPPTEVKKPTPPPGERVEYVPPTEVPRGRLPPATPESKVALSQQARAAEETQALQKIEALRQQFGADLNVEKVVQRSATERALAGEAIRAFKDRLTAGVLTPQDVRRAGLELISFRDRLEELQAEARTVSRKDLISPAMNENFRALDEINRFIYACSLEDPKDAAARLKYETPDEKRKEQRHLVNVEKMKETDPRVLVAQIESRYGYHPEDLKSGNVKGLRGWYAGLKFRIKDRLSHVIGAPSEYDEYRQALSLAPPRPEIQPAPPEEYAEVREGEFKVVEEKPEIPAPPAELMREAAVEAPLLAADAQRIIPQAEKLWNLVNEKISQHPDAGPMISQLGLRDLKFNDSATSYVLTLAKYIRARDAMADRQTQNRLYEPIAKFNKILGIEGNALVQSILAQKFNLSDVTRGARERRGRAMRQEARMKF